jgi:SNF2 family DNA or RNA helicase
MSDPGTGKTRAALDAIVELKKQGLGRTLVLAPKSILEPAWGNDIRKFTPELTYSLALAPKRDKAFKTSSDIVITNHDAATWLAEHPNYLHGFDLVIMDEITAYKHRTAARSKAMAEIVPRFERRAGLTGTPIANDLLHIWHQAFLLDSGTHLGSSFFRFRAAVCHPYAAGFFTDWIEKDGARDAVAGALSPITVRHRFEDCVDIPEHTQRVVSFTLDPLHYADYEEMLVKSLLQLDDGKVIDAVHAAALTNKLLQICAGSVYDGSGSFATLSAKRYELVTQLVEEREQCVVAFRWKHQRDNLIKHAEKAGLTYAVIDSDTAKDHAKIVREFQEGKIRVVFAQPQSAAHGLTLTRGTTTIWASPISDAERFIQFNRRIYRTGQTRKTETIVIVAEDTIEERVYYDVLSGRVSNLAEMLALVQTDLKNKS